ncbi:glycosyltransferase [Azospirillum soli]|uniref:glycosyltransferase n=1 Tax=Azospirillum soli TaxID=1304799 RepID=UPI001AE1D1A2|nr:glycosyltransferase [Azospirillum soli]MBP2316242.1 glycosyltransferase involved in cell wall biosynthesis [Azospirillum soli]
MTAGPVLAKKAALAGGKTMKEPAVTAIPSPRFIVRATPNSVEAPPLPDASALHGLIEARRFEECLSVVRALMPRSPGAGAEAARLLGVERLCLARQGRWAEAAEAGARLLATGRGTADDRFRQAQILMRLHRHDDALPLAIAAVQEIPDAPRFIGAAVEAALVVANGPARLCRALAGMGDNGVPDPPSSKGAVLFPQELTFGNGRFDHPSIAGMFAAVPNLAVHKPTPALHCMLRHLPAILDRAVRYLAALLDVHPCVDRATAACFVATRLHAWTEPDDGWLFDFLSPFPASLGQRPWVYCHDFMPALFIPVLPVDEVQVTPDTALYWILKGHLEANYCIQILTHCPRTLGHLGDFFDSPAIAGKVAHVNTWHRPNKPVRKSPQMARTWLFTSSFFESDAFFYMRGGVETLNAFLVLAEEFPDIRLILRARLPEGLSPRLREAVAHHPRIDHYDSPVDEAVLDELFAAADLYLMPCPTIFRNGLAEALQAGLVPVVADTIGIGDFVRDDENGIVVGGLEAISKINLDPPELTFRTAHMWSDDRPACPDFFEELLGRLRHLHRTPAEFARLAAHNQTTMSDAVFGAMDQTRFADAMRESATRASDIRQRGEPLRLPSYRRAPR